VTKVNLGVSKTIKLEVIDVLQCMSQGREKAMSIKPFLALTTSWSQPGPIIT
jgi:hypothetical protein